MTDVGDTVTEPDAARDNLIRAQHKLCWALDSETAGIDVTALEARLSDIETRIEALDSINDILTEAEDLDASMGTTEKISRYQEAIQQASEHGIALPEVAATLDELPTTSPPDDDEDTELESNSTTAEDEDGSDKPATSTETIGRKKQMVDDIEAVASRLERIPKYDDMHELGSFQAQAYSQEFGDWGAALAATSLPVEEWLVDNLQEIEKQLGRAPTHGDLDEHSQSDENLYTLYFDDHDRALAAAGIDSPDRQALLDELTRLEAEFGFPPTSSHVSEHGRYPVGQYRTEFESVRDAATTAGLDYESAVLDAIRAVAISVGRPPKIEEFNEYSRYSSSFVYNFFDSWNDALVAAGVGTEPDVTALIHDLPKTNTTELITRTATVDNLPIPDVLTETAEDGGDGGVEGGEEGTGPVSEEDTLLRDIEAVVESLGRVPTYQEARQHEGFDPQGATEVFGNWEAALRASTVNIESRLLDALLDVADELGRAPTKAEVDEYGTYDAHRYETYFDSWAAARDAAGVALPDDDTLLSGLERLRNELGFVPANHHVDEHGQFPSQFYRRRFGSVKQATKAADMDYREDVIAEIQAVAKSVGRRPKVSDFETHAVYSNSYIYDVFDSWEDACEAADVATDGAVQALTEGTGSTSDAEVAPSQLAEYYELFGTLYEIHTQLLGDNIAATLGEDEPMVRWHEQILDQWGGKLNDSPETGYGAHLFAQDDIDMTAYRTAYGNGDTVTEFEAVETEPLPSSVAELLALLSDMNRDEARELRVPKTPRSEKPVPILVESIDEYERAVALLRKFPDAPSLIESTTNDPEDGDPDQEASDQDGTGSLTEINGVTESVAAALQAAGYESKADLKAADAADLASVDGVGSQRANRIKLIVGG